MKNSLIYNTRITADIDPPDVEKKLKHCLEMFKKYGFNKDIEVRTSPSGKGKHVVAWSDVGLPEHELLLLRRIAGDDPMRVYLDSKPGRMKQVLFSNKRRIIKNG